MDLIINPSKSLSGTLKAPSSKSYSHRAFLAASLAKGQSLIAQPLMSEDVKKTINALLKLGIPISKKDQIGYLVEGFGGRFTPTTDVINCGNSGTTVRILSVLSLLVEGGLKLKGEFFDRKRPIEPLFQALRKLGAKVNQFKDYVHLVREREHCALVELPGHISSQFLTALLMICPILPCEKNDNVTIILTTPLKSYPYIKITLDVLNHWGIKIIEDLDPNRTGNYVIPLNQNYHACKYNIPGDFSAVAFFIAAGALSIEDCCLEITNLDFNTVQGDKQIIEILQKMGAKIEVNIKKNSCIVYGNRVKHPLKGITINCENIPDLFPILTIVGAFAYGKTVLTNITHIRYKESDRVEIIARELKKMGVDIHLNENELIISHSDAIKGITIKHENDHRIAMALSIAALSANGASKISNIEIVNDSYPDFFNDLKRSGIELLESKMEER
jgi:3-phosphoshikimate 1-carboxyvinyltransferase